MCTTLEKRPSQALRLDCATISLERCSSHLRGSTSRCRTSASPQLMAECTTHIYFLAGPMWPNREVGDNMTNELTTIKAQKRAPGLAKSKIKQLRRDGYVPGILYGKNLENTELQINVKDLPKTGHTGAVVIKLDLEGKTKDVLMREVQVDTLKDRILHIDFQEVTESEKVHVNVPVEYVGLTREQQKEGRFRIHRRTLRVKAKVADVPEKFTVDVSHLKLEESSYLRDLKLPESIFCNSQSNLALATLAKN